MMKNARRRCGDRADEARKRPGRALLASQQFQDTIGLRGFPDRDFHRRCSLRLWPRGRRPQAGAALHRRRRNLFSTECCFETDWVLNMIASWVLRRQARRLHHSKPGTGSRRRHGPGGRPVAATPHASFEQEVEWFLSPVLPHQGLCGDGMAVPSGSVPFSTISAFRPSRMTAFRQTGRSFLGRDTARGNNAIYRLCPRAVGLSFSSRLTYRPGTSFDSAPSRSAEMTARSARSNEP
jgi:hypothetical protein